jgi:hypothetical protein
MQDRERQQCGREPAYARVNNDQGQNLANVADLESPLLVGALLMATEDVVAVGSLSHEPYPASPALGRSDVAPNDIP